MNSPVVGPAQVHKIVICNQNADGSYSPSSKVTKVLTAHSPIAQSNEVTYVCLFTQTADGSLSPVVV